MGKPRKDIPYIYVELQSCQLKEDLVNIAKNKGFSTLTAYVRHLLINARDASSDHLKRNHKDT